MSELIKVRVTKVSAAPSKNGNYIHSLKTEGKTVTVMGVPKTSGVLTYFIALKNPVAVGTEHNLNFDELSVNARTMTDADGAAVLGSDGSPIVLKWLSVK